MTPYGTCLVFHGKRDNHTPWGYHVTPGWDIGPSLDNCRFMKCYMPKAGIVHTTDTLQYILKAFDLPEKHK